MKMEHPLFVKVIRFLVGFAFTMAIVAAALTLVHRQFTVSYPVVTTTENGETFDVSSQFTILS